MVTSVRWNIIPHRAKPFLQSDAIVVSIPKSGRTWLRFFLQSYFCALEGITFSVKTKFDNPDIPNVIFTHDLFEHAVKSGVASRWLGRQLIPLRARRNKPKVLIARDPRDLIVSLYFHMTKRESKRRFVGSISSMMRHETLGINNIVSIMNAWMCEWGECENLLLLRYEDCRKDPTAHFSNLLGFIGCNHIDERAFNYAIDNSSFDNMKLLESGGQVDSSMLTPGKKEDPDSYKVRRGLVGGYRDYISTPDMDYLDESVRRLDSRFGYNNPA
jgi:hypothetical protein